MAIEDTIGNAARWYDSNRRAYIYEMKYETAYRFFCMLDASGNGGTINVYATSDESTIVETLTWNTGSSTPSAVGKYFLINDYSAAVKDIYAGEYISSVFPRYRVNNPEVFKVLFTVPASWCYDSFPQKVEVEFFESDDYYRLVETGLTGSYTLSTPGVNAIVWPAGSAGSYWPTVYEFCDDTYDSEGVPSNSKGLVLRMDYEAGGVSMPYDFRGILIQQPRYIIDNNVRGWASESMEPPTEGFSGGQGNLTDITLKWIDAVAATGSNESAHICTDWVVSESVLYDLITSAGYDPAAFFASAYDADSDTYTYIAISSSGSRYFAILNFLGTSPDDYPKTGEVDVTSAIIAQVNPTYYSYTFPTDGENSTLPAGASQQLPTGGISMGALKPMPNPDDSVYTDSAFVDLPCAVFRNSSLMQGVTISGYAANTVINAADGINHIEAENLHCCYITGETTNLVFNRSAAWYFQMSTVEILTFVKYLEVVSVLAAVSYEFSFATLQYYDMTEAEVTYATLPFKTDVVGKSYELRIFGNHGITSQLTGGPSPISITEESNKFAFTLLRDQSGYIQFLNEGGEDGVVTNLLPEQVSDRPVGLYDTVQEKYVWLGFIKPEAFEQEICIDKQIISLPVIGLTYAARSKGFIPPFTDERNMTVGSALATVIYLVQAMHSIPLENVVIDYADQFIGGTTANPTDTSWLRARINTDVFREYDSDGNESWKYSCADVLKEFCAFFGLTCRVEGRTVYLLAIDDLNRSHNIVSMPVAELVMVGFTSDYTPTVTSVSQSSISPFAGPFASRDVKVSLTPALSDVRVKCAKDDQSENITMWGGFLTEKYWQYILANNNWRNTMEEASLFNPSEDVYRLMATWREKRDTSTAGYAGWVPEALVPVTYETGGTTYAVAVEAMTRRRVLIQNAVVSLEVTTKTYSNGEEVNPTLSSIEVEVVRKADVYGEQDKILYEASIDINSSELTLTDGTTVSDATGTDPDYVGRKLFEVSGDDYYYGWIYLRIRRGNSAAVSTYDVITDLTLHITPMLGIDDAKTEFHHKMFNYAAGGSQNISTIFISSVLPNILNRVASVTRYDADETDYNPSKALAQRMADYHGKPRKAYRLHIRGDYASSGITPLSYATKDGKRYIPIAVETDIRKNSYTLTLIEMPTS